MHVLERSKRALEKCKRASQRLRRAVERPRCALQCLANAYERFLRTSELSARGCARSRSAPKVRRIASPAL